MKKLNNYRELSIFLLLLFLAVLFPLTSKDLIFANFQVESFKDFLSIANGKFLMSAFSLVLSKYKILKVLVYAVVTTSLFVLLKNIISKKNYVLLSLAVFLFFLIDKEILAFSYVGLSGFLEYFMGTLFLLLFYNIFTKGIVNVNPLVLIVLGLAGTSISPIYSFTIFLITLIFLFIFKDKEVSKKNIFLLIGEIVGLVIISRNTSIQYTGFVNNLFYEFIPLVRDPNFIITFVLSALLLVQALKIYNTGKRKEALMSILGVSSFLFVSLLSKSHVLYYITFLVNLLASLYILLNSNSSRIFKRNVFAWFTFKLAYIFSLLILGNINFGSLLFLAVLDILMILQIYNYLLPKEYLNTVWTIAACTLLISNIYIYQKVLVKYNEMNFYIKNKMECSINEFGVPQKYKTDYVFGELPNSKEEISWYIDYYDISPYSIKIQEKFYFNE